MNCYMFGLIEANKGNSNEFFKSNQDNANQHLMYPTKFVNAIKIFLHLTSTFKQMMTFAPCFLLQFPINHSECGCSLWISHGAKQVYMQNRQSS